MNELSSYVFSPLREGDISLYRGSGSGLAPILGADDGGIIAESGGALGQRVLHKIRHRAGRIAHCEADGLLAGRFTG